MQNHQFVRLWTTVNFVYEQSKKEKEAKKKQKVISIKEIRVSLTIEEHDIDIKAKNARKFLLDGDKVKITVRFRGREMELGHIGERILNNFTAKLEDVSIIEKRPKREGRSMTLVLGLKRHNLRGGFYHAKNEES